MGSHTNRRKRSWAALPLDAIQSTLLRLLYPKKHFPVRNDELAGLLNSGLFGFVSKEIDEELERRTKSSQRILEESEYLSLREFQVFVFNRKQRWVEIEGETLRKTPFGLWVSNSHYNKTQLVEVMSWLGILVVFTRRAPS